MGVALLSHAFNGGVISPLLLSRPEQQRYQSGCLVMKNFVALPQGPATRRAGTYYMGEAKDQPNTGNPVILEEFIFSQNEARLLEFGVGYMRVWTRDGLVMSGGSPYELATPYTAADVPLLTFAQSADVVFVACGNQAPRKISRLADDNWTIEVLTFEPTIQPPTGGTGTFVPDPKASAGTYTVKYKVATVSQDGELSVGSATIEVPDGRPVGEWYTDDYVNLSWDAVPDALEYRIYKEKTGVFGFIGKAVGGDTTFRDGNIGPDIADAPIEAENPFDAAGKYPRLVFFHQQRLGWASTAERPLGIWLSWSSDFDNLSYATPPQADQGIDINLAAQRVNRIAWCQSKKDLCIGTEGSEVILTGSEGDALTPTNTKFETHTRCGSEAGLPALVVGQSVLYLQRGGSQINEFLYDYREDGFVSPDLTIFANSIFFGKKVVSWTYQQAPYSVIWCVLDDGTLAACTYMRMHEVAGWHTHETDGFVERVACIPNGDKDEVWLVVRRTVDGVEKRYIERMADFFVLDTDLRAAHFVDCGILYDGAPTTTITGLGHLSGREVVILADGAAVPPRVVSGGSITLDQPASVVHVGLSFKSRLRPTRPELTSQNGTTLSRVYNVKSVNIRVLNSMGLWAGADNASLEEVVQRDATDPAALPFSSGDKEIVIATGWTDEWKFIMQVDDPTPATIHSVTYDTDVGETT